MKFDELRQRKKNFLALLHVRPSAWRLLARARGSRPKCDSRKYTRARQVRISPDRARAPAFARSLVPRRRPRTSTQRRPAHPHALRASTEDCPHAHRRRRRSKDAHDLDAGVALLPVQQMRLVGGHRPVQQQHRHALLELLAAAKRAVRGTRGAQEWRRRAHHVAKIHQARGRPPAAAAGDRHRRASAATDSETSRIHQIITLRLPLRPPEKAPPYVLEGRVRENR